MQPNWQESKNIDLTIIAIQDTHLSRTRCVYGPPRAADLSTVAEECCHAMVGAQLWLLLSTAAKRQTMSVALARRQQLMPLVRLHRIRKGLPQN